MQTVFWIAAACCIAGEIAILRALIESARSPLPAADAPHRTRGAEILWAVLPGIALAVVLFATWRAVTAVS